MSNFRRLFISILPKNLGVKLLASKILGIAILGSAVCTADTTPDIEHGKATFNTMCSVCHSVQKTGGPIEGPNLLGLVGREAASQPDFTKYSTALKDSKLTWSEMTLNKFLLNPMAMVPGTLMPMRIPNDKTRSDVIAYLATLKQSEASD